MNNSDKPAMPTPSKIVQLMEEGYQFDSTGLTKREYFAGLAMQGVLTIDAKEGTSNATLATVAVCMADALIKELEK